RYPADAVLVDLAISGLAGLEVPMLERLLPEAGETDLRTPVEMLAATVLNRGEAAELEQVARWAADESKPREQRLALLAGMRRRLPQVPRGADHAPLVELARQPVGLVAAASSPDSLVRSSAAGLLSGLTWPGKPADPSRSRPRPMTAEEEARFDAGRQVFLTT